MPDDKIRVLPRGTARVQDYGALMGSGMNRFHGWTLDSTLGKPFTDPATRQPRRHAVYLKKLGVEAAVEISVDDPYYGEYVRHLRDGDLWPADLETAQRANVKFDPTFGDEHGDKAKAEFKAAVADLVKRHGQTPPPEVPGPKKTDTTPSAAKAGPLAAPEK